MARKSLWDLGAKGTKQFFGKCFEYNGNSLPCHEIQTLCVVKQPEQRENDAGPQLAETKHNTNRLWSQVCGSMGTINPETS